ncbi:hypothetical protein NSA23_06635 [Anaerosalibacter massiliensis]|uniref:Uncharacterized protein n=2 Tax=Anaerosalibacter massiliensis TaxID=1347392 RepID=A0A9X2MIM9_9FIRM|nr:hypothetical protein [Anaerosalibacter massiliensis]MCR2043795.1 hypothetical protein [Anaerosalibacter massiliensis]
MCNNNKDVLQEFLQRMEDVLSSSTIHKETSKIEKEVQLLESKKNKLVNMRLEDIIDKETYEEKYTDILQKIDVKIQDIQDREKLTSNLEEEKDIKNVY